MMLQSAKSLFQNGPDVLMVASRPTQGTLAGSRRKAEAGSARAQAESYYPRRISFRPISCVDGDSAISTSQTALSAQSQISLSPLILQHSSAVFCSEYDSLDVQFSYFPQVITPPTATVA
jgi:hypothetical protein